MKLSGRILNMSGALYGFFFYIRFVYRDWDNLILGAGSLAFLIGLWFAYREEKLRFSEKGGNINASN